MILIYRPQCLSDTSSPVRPRKPRDIPVLPGLDHARVVLLHVDLAGDAVGDHVRLGQLVVCGGARARTLWRQESVLQVVVVLGARGLDQTLLQHLLQVRLVVMFWRGWVGGGGMMGILLAISTKLH